MTIQRARKILGEKYAKYTDGQIEQIVNSLEKLAEISIETVLKMTPAERKTLDDKIKREKSG